MALLMFASTGFAKWEGGYLSNDGKMTLYFDNETIQVNYPLFRSWSLMDFKDPIANNMLSAKILTEYDCDEKKKTSSPCNFLFWEQGRRKDTFSGKL